eukprot:997842-Amphidinium_carterae.2
MASTLAKDALLAVTADGLYCDCRTEWTRMFPNSLFTKRSQSSNLSNHTEKSKKRRKNDVRTPEQNAASSVLWLSYSRLLSSMLVVFCGVVEMSMYVVVVIRGCQDVDRGAARRHVTGLVVAYFEPDHPRRGSNCLLVGLPVGRPMLLAATS